MCPVQAGYTAIEIDEPPIGPRLRGLTPRLRRRSADRERIQGPERIVDAEELGVEERIDAQVRLPPRRLAEHQPAYRGELRRALTASRRRFSACNPAKVGAPAGVRTVRWVGWNVAEHVTDGDLEARLFANLPGHTLHRRLASLAPATRQDPEALLIVRYTAEQQQASRVDDGGLIADFSSGHERVLRRV
jgi:hypothetical protein